MTAPIPDLSTVIPLKYKTLISLIGSGLSFVVPFVLESADALPAPWPAVIGVVLFILSALGVYKAPYKPAGTSLVPSDVAAAGQVATSAPAPAINVQGTIGRSPGEFTNPWR